MYIFFDTEFTGLQKDTDLISIGLISYDGRAFYAELTDYRKELCNDWIQKNVIDNLILNHPELKSSLFGYHTGDPRYHTGTAKEISVELREWLGQFTENITLVSDVCHYDMVLLLDLFGGAMNLPVNVNPACYDIVHDITKYIKLYRVGFGYGKASICDIRNNHAEKEAFNINREKLVNDLARSIGFTTDDLLASPDTLKHNALYDARVIRLLFILLDVRFRLGDQ